MVVILLGVVVGEVIVVEVLVVGDVIGVVIEVLVFGDVIVLVEELVVGEVISQVVIPSEIDNTVNEST